MMQYPRRSCKHTPPYLSQPTVLRQVDNNTIWALLCDHGSFCSFQDVDINMQSAYRSTWQPCRIVARFGQSRALRHHTSAASLHGGYFRLKDPATLDPFVTVRHLHPLILTIPHPLRPFVRWPTPRMLRDSLLLWRVRSLFMCWSLALV